MVEQTKAQHHMGSRLRPTLARTKESTTEILDPSFRFQHATAANKQQQTITEQNKQNKTNVQHHVLFLFFIETTNLLLP